MSATANGAGAERPAPRLNDTQLKEVMRLIKGAHSVELKVSVPASAHRATVQGLPGDPVDAQPRQIYFFDTPDLKLFQAGVVVRARRIAGGRGDTVVKLRPVEPDEISADLKNDAAFNIEVDALPGGFVCSASFKGRSTGQAIRDVASGKKRLSKIFSKGQRAFYKAHAPTRIDLDSLVPLGPTFILKGRFNAAMGIDGRSVRSMVAEMWLYPDGTRILELSTKCLPREALAVAAEARAYLVDHGVPTNAAQETKTRTALEFYSKALLEEEAIEKSAATLASAKRAPAKRSPAKAAAKPVAKAAAKPVAKAAPKPAPRKPATTRAAAKPAAPKKAPPKPAAAKPAAAKRTISTSSRARASRSSTSARTTPRARTATRQNSPRRSSG